MSECRHVITWQVVNGVLDNPRAMRADLGLANTVANARGDMTGAQVKAEWDMGRAVRTRLSVVVPLDVPGIPNWGAA